MKKNSFVALDFEYLIRGRHDTPCQLGMVVVADDVVIERWGTLIHVPDDIEGELSPGNGITREMMLHAPLFEDVISRIEIQCRGYELVAHNASTEQAVLSKTCERYGIQTWLTETTWHDTRTLMCGKSLEDACAELDIPLTHHHDALADAEACARIYSKVIGQGIKEPAVRVHSPRTPHRQKQVILPPPTTSSEVNDLILAGKNVVVTGTFRYYNEDREKLKEQLRSIEANVQSGIRKNTDILIVGDYGTTGWDKLEKAKKLGIRIVYETDIIALL